MERLTHNVHGYNQIITCGNSTCDEICKKTPDCYDCRIQKVIDKLSELEDLEQQGLLVKLPCKIGDAVYRIWTVGGKRKVADFTVSDFRYIDSKWFVIVVKNQTIRQWEFELFGSVVFVNKQQAEQALKEMEEENE